MIRTYTTSADLAAEVTSRIDPRPEYFETINDYAQALDIIAVESIIEWVPEAFQQHDVDLADRVVAAVNARLGIEI
jgi:hypothetical protein